MKLIYNCKYTLGLGYRENVITLKKNSGTWVASDQTFIPKYKKNRLINENVINDWCCHIKIQNVIVIFIIFFQNYNS